MKCSKRWANKIAILIIIKQAMQISRFSTVFLVTSLGFPVLQHGLCANTDVHPRQTPCKGIISIFITVASGIQSTYHNDITNRSSSQWHTPPCHNGIILTSSWVDHLHHDGNTIPAPHNGIIPPFTIVSSPTLNQYYLVTCDRHSKNSR